MSDTYRPCELCGAADPRTLFDSRRLDGPLVRCQHCNLVYVGRREQDFAFFAADESRSRKLAARVDELDLVRPDVEAAERPWRLGVERERLAVLQRHVATGTLLDVGCSSGLFLEAALDEFDVMGVEPDPATSTQARAKGLQVITGALDDVAPRSDGFDAITMFHTIEHLGSPRNALRLVRDLLRPRGVVMIETPTVDCLWFKIAPKQWRQLLPDHYFFFSRETLSGLLEDCGFRPVWYAKVGRRVSARLVADRLRRMHVPAADSLLGLLRTLRLEDVSVYVRPGDIMTIVAEVLQ